MRILFWLCFTGLIAGLLIRIPFAGGGILITDILIPLFSGIWLIKKIITNDKFPKNSFFLPGLVFAFIALISFILNAHTLEFKEQVLSFSYLIRFVSTLILGVAATELFQKDRKKFFHKLFLISGFTILLGFLQFYLFPSLSNISTEGGFDPHTGRLLGTWMDPNYLGGFLAFIIPILFAQTYKDISKRKIARHALIALFFVFAIFLTFSRSAYLAVASGLFLFFLFRDRKIIIIGIFIIALGITINERAQKRVTEFAGTVKSIIFQDTDEIDPTANLRIQNWRKSYELFEKNKLVGIGFNTYRFKAAEEGIIDENFFSAGGADSTPLTILVTSGILGFLSFTYFCIKILFKSLKRYLLTKDEIYLGFCGGFLAMLVHSLFVNSFMFPLIFLPIMAVAGVLENRK